MKYLLLISCLVLCFCSPEKETEPIKEPVVKEPIKPDKPTQFGPCLVCLDPLYLECPPEDIAECPIDYGDALRVSAEELSFGKQGGVRCITTSGPSPLYAHDAYVSGCQTKFITELDTI